MGNRRRKSCQRCGAHASDVGEISWAGNCAACGEAAALEVMRSLQKRDGPVFTHWRERHAAAVGAIFPGEPAPAVSTRPKLTPKQQRTSRKSRYWRQLREERLELAAGLCELRFEGCIGTATSVHLNPALGGDHKRAVLEDCRAACVVCHGYVDGIRSAPRVDVSALVSNTPPDDAPPHRDSR